MGNTAAKYAVSIILLIGMIVDILWMASMLSDGNTADMTDAMQWMVIFGILFRQLDRYDTHN